MPPKKVTTESEDVDSKFSAILAQLSCITKRLDKVDLLGEQLTNIEETMASVTAENTIIRQTQAAHHSTLLDIQNNQIRMDQYNRSWSVRIMNLQLQPEEEEDPFELVDAVYNKVFLPILKGALDQKSIKKIPTCEQLLERAHVLPATKTGTIKPIICRFFNRDYRAICFRFKKEYATREGDTIWSERGAAGGTAGGGPPGSKQPRYAYPFYEDLPTATFKKMKELQADSRVETCWTINGQIRYRLAGSDQVKRVKQSLDSIDTILK